MAAPASFHRGQGGGETRLVWGPTCAAISTQTWTPVKNLTNISQILCMISVLKISQTHTTYRLQQTDLPTSQANHLIQIDRKLYRSPSTTIWKCPVYHPGRGGMPPPPPGAATVPLYTVNSRYNTSKGFVDSFDITGRNYSGAYLPKYLI